MNNKETTSNFDPRTQYVPEKYSFLAADFLTTTKQNKEYWHSVKTPLAPSDRIACEQLRQMAVFLPLLPIVFTFHYLGKIAAVISFLIALMVMRKLHLNIQRDIRRKWKEWLDRDQGRYAFTQFMCKELNLLPHDVTLELVDKMYSDFLLLADARRRLEMEKKNLSGISRQGDCDIGSLFTDEKQAVGTRRIEKYENCASQEFHNFRDENILLKLNPATGLPMMDECFDVHGNTFGTSYIEDIWSSSNSSSFDASNDFVNSGGSSFADDTGI